MSEEKKKTLSELFCEPFDESDIEWKPQHVALDKNGNPYAIVLAYVSARAIQNRLDSVVGPEKWSVSYEFIDNTAPYKGVLCHLSLNVNNTWVTKTDGAEATDFEAFKGGISSAFKRAAVLWGMGRYLYDLEGGFAKIVPSKTGKSKSAKVKTPQGDKWFHWEPPDLPNWALPKKVQQPKVVG